MIYVWEIDACVIFNLGSGKSVLAFILENRRAVAFVKNKAHRDFIMDNLSHEVKVQGLAPDSQPAKPEQLTSWEAKRGNACQPAPVRLGAAGAGVTSRLPAPASMPSSPTTRCGPTLPGPVPPPSGSQPPQTTTGGLVGFGAMSWSDGTTQAQIAVPGKK